MVLDLVGELLPLRRVRASCTLTSAGMMMSFAVAAMSWAPLVRRGVQRLHVDLVGREHLHPVRVLVRVLLALLLQLRERVVLIWLMVCR